MNLRVSALYKQARVAQGMRTRAPERNRREHKPKKLLTTSVWGGKSPLMVNVFIQAPVRAECNLLRRVMGRTNNLKQEG